MMFLFILTISRERYCHTHFSDVETKASIGGVSHPWSLSPYVADLNITLCSMFFLPYLFCCIHATYCSDRQLVFWVYGEGFLDPCCSKHGLGTSSAA